MTIKFIKMKDKDEIAADVEITPNEYILNKPIKILHLVYDNRNYITFKEYVNPTLVLVPSVTISKYDVLFINDVTDRFADEYEQISEAIYNPKITEADEEERSIDLQLEREEMDSLGEDDTVEDNVLSFYEALMKKNDKSIH